MNEMKESLLRNTEKFKDYPLDNEIKRGLSELGFKSPLEVQSKVIPLILEDKDLIVKSQTGSGKTAAFAIPLCQKIDAELQSPQVLVLTPTRELADQVKGDMAEIAKYTSLTFSAIYGKQPMDIQRKELKQKPHVIVATPGRLMDHLINKNVKLQDIKYLVLDEADEMLLMGFQDQIEAILNKVSTERVTLLFSATVSEDVQRLSQQYMINPEYIEIEPEFSSIDKIQQFYYAVDGLKKVDLMKKIIEREHPRKAIIFCNTQEQVNSLLEILKKWNRGTCAVHGGMDQTIRKDNLTSFKRGECNLLIATDMAARGLHVQGVTHVINYGVPFEQEQYVHRIGRTGRVDEHGVAISLVIPTEMERFSELETYLGYKIPCRGGQVNKKPLGDPLQGKKREGFKVPTNKGKASLLQFNGGRINSPLKRSDFLTALRGVDGVYTDDIGRIEMRDNETRVEVFQGKEELILRAFKTKRIKGKLYRVKKG